MRRDSDASDESLELNKLEQIVRQNLTIRRSSARKGSLLGSKTSVRKLLHSRKQSSAASATDTEALDNELHVPSCEVSLDNSKTLAYSGGASDLSDEEGDDERRHGASQRRLRDQEPMIGWFRDRLRQSLDRIGLDARVRGVCTRHAFGPMKTC